MICYLIRHGKDDDTIRGGWSSAPLTEQGVAQVEALAKRMAFAQDMKIAHVFSSDLLRARQTAEIISREIALPVTYLPQFREVNNGVLAGMENTEALVKFPGLFWNTLEWEETYPEGESPRAFFERISKAWYEFTGKIQGMDGNVVLVTHGGVINVILHIVNGLEYSNKTKSFPVKNAEPIAVEL